MVIGDFLVAVGNARAREISHLRRGDAPHLRAAFDQFSLELRDGTENLEDEVADWTLEINVLLNGDETHLVLLEFLEDREEMLEAAREAINLPDEHGIVLSCAYVLP